jgi:FkbM family methyltransferase
MSPESEARSRSLQAAIEALYQRLQNGALTSADIVPLEALDVPTHEKFLARVFADSAVFDARFGTFKQAYDIFRVFREGETVLDVGAHWGYSALSMRNQGCRAQVVSVEAMPFHIPALELLKTLAGGSYDYVHVAASDAERRLVFYVPVVNGKLVGGLSSTGGTLVPHLASIISGRAADFPPPEEGAPDQVGFAVVEADARPLDDIVESLSPACPQVVAIKMDVEGHEAAALKGARGLITSRRPVLMVEGGMQPAVVARMREYGYLRAARVEGRLVPWDGHAKQSDTYWYHPDTVDALRNRGLVA